MSIKAAKTGVHLLVKSACLDKRPALALSGLAQEGFQIRSSDEAMPASFSGFISALSAISDRAAECDGMPQMDLGQDTFSFGTPDVVLPIPDSQPPPEFDENRIVVFTRQFADSVSAGKIAAIPAGTQFLLFDGQSGPANGELAMLTGTQSVSSTSVEIEPSDITYGTNVSASVDQIESLTYSTMPNSTLDLNGASLYIVSPSAVTVPEPGLLALMGIGGLFFGLNKIILCPTRR